MRITTEGFADSTKNRKAFIDVAMSVWQVVDRLIPGHPPFGNRDIVLIRNTPRVLWEPCDFDGSRYRISLNANTGNWQQLAYQLSHELGHVKMGPARSNLILEVLAESVSILALIEIEKEWKSNPPFKWNGWAKYAESLPKYRQDNVNLFINELPKDVTRPESESGSDRRAWLLQIRSQVDAHSLQHEISRAWQHLAATLLVEDVLLKNNELCHQLLGFAQHTTPSTEEQPAFREDLPINSCAIPAWIPDWIT